MDCNYELLGKTYTEAQLIEVLKNPSILRQIEMLEESFDPDEIELTDSEDGSKNIILSRFDNFINYQMSLISTLKNRAAALDSIIKSSDDPEFIKEKSSQKQEVEYRILELMKNVENIENAKSVGLHEMKINSMEDAKRVDKLLATGNLEDSAEAQKIINFYVSMEVALDKISTERELISSHPFFNEDEMFDEQGDIAVSDEVVTIMNDIARTFKDKQTKLTKLQRNLIEEIINENPKIKQLYDKLKYKDITKNMQDLSWVDMMIMDISKGIFSQNGIMPQVMMDTTQSVFAESISHVKKFEEKHNALLPKVEKILISMKQGLKGLGIKGVSFDMFFQKVLGDKNTGRLVHRYDQSFFDKRANVMKKYIQEIKLANNLDDIDATNKAIRQANLDKQKWFRENTMVFDINRLPEIAEAFPELAGQIEDDGGLHKQELIDEIDETGYKEEVQKQIKEIKKYLAHKQAYEDFYLKSIGVESKEELDPEEAGILELELAKDNPFLGASNFYNVKPSTIAEKYISPSMNFNISIPRKEKVEVKYKKGNERYVFEKTGTSTNFYDNNYAVIENEKTGTLKEYYDLLREEMDFIQQSFPAEIQEELLVNYLPSVRKSFTEKLADAKISGLKDIFMFAWDMIVELYDRIRGGFGINPESSISYENSDVVSGKTEYKINREFLTNNRKSISNRFNINKKRLANIYKSSTGKVLNIQKNTEMNVRQIPQSVLNELASMLNIPATVEAFKETFEIKNEFNDKVPIGNILFQSSTHEIVKQNSTNLPKIIKYYSMMAAEYRARQQLLPVMELMKQHYQQIKEVQTNNVGQNVINKFTGKEGTTGLRSRANTQMESWFERVILGNHGQKQFGHKKSEKKEKGLKGTLKNMITGKILSRDEKRIKKEIDDLIANETDPDELKKLQKMKESLGKDFAISAAIDNFLNYLRFLGLGYNLSSGVTNFLEGQSANIILAASGDYFEEKHFHRANGIIRGSFLKNMSFGKLATKGAKKTRALVDKFDILQDSSNELQKASTKTAFSKFAVLNPMEINKRVEYLNQSPLMIAILMNTSIKSKDGKELNVWDAMDENGNLLPEFQTEENIEAWHENKGETYTSFKTKVNQAIVTAHGNYDNLRGMLAKTSVLGKAAMMFKTWVGSALYGRFAIKQEDLELGDKEYKGRYWSHTPMSAALQGTIAGFTIAGTGGLAIGAGLGLGVAGIFGIRSNLGMLQEMVFLVKALIRKSIGNPINMLAGKELIKSHPNYDKLKGNKFTERDAKNMKANIADMSILLTWVGLTLLTKAMFWDDDDDPDSPERLAHNLLANRFIQLAGQGAAYVYPPDLYENFVGNMPILRWGNDVKKATGALNEYLKGNDVITSGVNAGESRLQSKLSKLVLPSLVKDSHLTSLGFGTAMERQFEKTEFDDWFWSSYKKEKKIIQGKRASLKSKLKYEGYPDEVIEEIVNARLPLPMNPNPKL